MNMKNTLAVPAIFEYPGVHIQSDSSTTRMESGVLKMVRRIRPDWKKEDIILQKSNDGQGLVYGGYTVNKAESVMIRIFESLGEPEQDQIRMMRVFAFLRLGPRIYATFSNGFAHESVVGIPLDYTLGIDFNVYPLVAYKVGYMHRELRYIYDNLKPEMVELYQTLIVVSILVKTDQSKMFSRL